MNVSCRKCGCLRIHDYDTICNFCGTPFEQDNFDGIGFHDDSEKYSQQTELADPKEIFAQMKDICIPVAPCNTIEECQRMVWNYEYLQKQYIQLNKKTLKNVPAKIISILVMLGCFQTLVTVLGVGDSSIILYLSKGLFSAMSSLLPLVIIFYIIYNRNNNHIRQLTFHYNQYTQAKRVLRKNNIL